MNDEEKIKQLEEVVDSLKQKLSDQQHQITELSGRLNALAGRKGVVFVRPKEAHEDSASWTSENFIGLRLINLVGIVVLVIGISIGVKYAIDRNLISEAARILLAYFAGMVLYVLSWRLKKQYHVFSAILLSGAMATLYFTTYAAFSYYQMIPFALAFGLMVAMTVFTSWEAIQYDRQEIALLGLVGAYAVPFLVSRNQERADLFFLYILMINMAVVYLGHRKSWFGVTRMAQLVTWVLFLGWAMTRRQENSYFPEGVLFMVAFFILFTVSVLNKKIAFRKPLAHGHPYQQLSNNIAAFLASLFLFAPDFSLEHVAAVTGCFALLVAGQTWLYYRFFPEETFLRTLHLVMALVLSILYVLFEWTGFIVTLIWMFMAVALFIAGFRIRSVALRLASIALMGLTLFKLLLFDSLTFSPVEKVIAYLSLGILLLITSFFYQKFREKIFEE